MSETWVIVDDYDRAINYTGPWIWTAEATDAVSTAIAFENTGHAVGSNVVNETTSPASFFYEFSGSKLAVYGIAATFNRSVQVPGPGFPEWACIIDDSVVLPSQNPYGVFPLQSYCETDTLDDGPHTLEFRIMDSGLGLWFDSLRFLPSPGAASDSVPAKATAWIDSTDSKLEYGPGWRSLSTGFMSTKSSVATPFQDPAFFMKFNGSSLTWYGFSKAAIEKAQPSLPALSLANLTTSSGFYQIDNGPFFPFAVDLSVQIVAPELNPYNTILFRTPSTASGPHNLTVYYDGNSTVWPLTLDYITVEDAFITSAGVNGSTKGSKSAIVGGAVGGVLGGIVLVFLALFVLRWWRVRKNRQNSDKRAMYLASNDIKLRPFSKIVETDKESQKDKTQGHYPFSFSGAK